MGKTKKFIDKKKSATFQLLARDTSDPYYDNSLGNDRVFVQVDNNPHSVGPFFAQEDDVLYNNAEDPDSIFADAPEDGDFEEGGGTPGNFLPDHVRREILELRFPDDGYNYLLHLREIKNTGSCSSYYQNPKANLDQLPHDVKEVKSNDVNDNAIYGIAAKTVGVRVQKVIDPDVAKLLDDSDLSRFGSDVDDLEEDFVVQANLPEGGGENGDVGTDGKLDCVNGFQLVSEGVDRLVGFGGWGPEVSLGDVEEMGKAKVEGLDVLADEKPRVRCLLDEQFDLLEHQEYETDDEDCACDGYIAAEDELLADKLKNALNHREVDDLELDEDYKAPADILHANEKPKSKELLDSAADVMCQCVEYAKKYEHDDEHEDVVVVQESSSESEEWDCETIVSMYSNLDNHPARIEVPGTARKKIAEVVSGSLSSNSPVITLRGKEKLPVDFLPHGRKSSTKKVKVLPSLKSQQQGRKQHRQESKEDKKERKAAAKAERREARRVKKEMKGLYRWEAQLAQKVAAVSVPSSIHLF